MPVERTVEKVKRDREEIYEFLQQLSLMSTKVENTKPMAAAINDFIDSSFDRFDPKETTFLLNAVPVILARSNVQQMNGGPFGALIVEYEGGLNEKGEGQGKPHVIGVGINHVVPHSDPSAHAEMEAYRDAARNKGSSDLQGAAMFTSCECCPMCLSTANGSGIGQITYVETRHHADKEAGFSDRLQYELFKQPREEQMTSIKNLGLDEAGQKALADKLDGHGAVVLDDKGNVYSTGDATTAKDPTGLATVNAVRAAVKKLADEIHAGEREDQKSFVFCLPENFTLLSKDIPHPAGLITADWARMLRKRGEGEKASQPKYDGEVPNPRRIVHVTDNYEQLVVTNAQGDSRIPQQAEETYTQPAKRDEDRAVPTHHHNDYLIKGVAHHVFRKWGRDMNDQSAKDGKSLSY